MSGGGGGIIIIRSAIKSTLNDPLCGGHLPAWLQGHRDGLLAIDVNNWTQEDDHTALFLFSYMATHC